MMKDQDPEVLHGERRLIPKLIQFKARKDHLQTSGLSISHIVYRLNLGAFLGEAL